MGMFDELACMYPLPIREGYERTFQTKSLDCQMDQYLIKQDGTLWHEVYDTRLEENPEAFFGFYLHRDNKRWEAVDFTGEVRFYDGGDGPWYEFSAYFVGGQLKHLETIENPEVGSGNQATNDHSDPTRRSEAP